MPIYGMCYAWQINSSPTGVQIWDVIMHALCEPLIWGVMVIFLYWTCMIHSLIFLDNSNFSTNRMAALFSMHGITMLQQQHLWHHNGVHNAALLVLPSTHNPHDTNWIKLEFMVDQIMCRIKYGLSLIAMFVVTLITMFVVTSGVIRQ